MHTVALPSGGACKGGFVAEAVVRAKNIVKTFGELRALDDVTLDVPRGIIYGLLGPNGAGKTTLIRVLTTLLRPDSGSATVAGVDVISDAARARTYIGLAGQFAAVDGFLTGRENVEMVGRLYNLTPAEAAHRADEVLERIRLSDAADRPVRTYSGGMRRRLDLAASMVGRPEVLFLDEPTTGIDPASRFDVWDLIDELVDQGTTILLTTQYLEEADRLAERIGVIDHGRLISEGTADELKDRVGGSVVEVALRPEDRELGMATLAELAGTECHVDERAGTFSIPAVRGVQTLTDAVRRLDAQSIEAIDIGLHKPTLDDVFLTLTGRAAEVGSAGNGTARKRGRGRQRSTA